MTHNSTKCTPLDYPGIRETEGAKTEHAPITTPSDTRPIVSAYRDYVTPSSTCAVEDTRSVHSNSEGSPDRVPTTNILSRMAKTKASWVENQKLPEQFPQRRSPILCKGRPLGSTWQTPYIENKLCMDRGTKGVRDEKKFDLLPISKYLSQYRDERKLRKEKRLPLVRISSYHTVCGCVDGLGFWDCSVEEPNEVKQTATFFTTKDVFKPFHARSLPTRGEALYVESTQDKLDPFIVNDIKLPRLYSNESENFVTETGTRFKTQHGRLDRKRNFAFPVIVSWSCIFSNWYHCWRLFRSPPLRHINPAKLLWKPVYKRGGNILEELFVSYQ